ncbi:MAG: type II toxin-antitoxin system VapC family toxin [Nitrospirota bacterium]|nr:type II toxin-antitoxin system VapC family toxin [Nitrospirota bacterium]MDH5699055.1 type II toxin-antitoxin system VapC family toxin [Nitrospirota bacterium]
MKVYVLDASVAIKWFIPEIHSNAALHVSRLQARLHVPAFIQLEVGSVLAKKIRREELTRDEGDVILKEFRHLPLQYHPNERLFHPAYALALVTHQSLYDCLYLALAETIDGAVITADRKFYLALSNGPYGPKIIWIEDIIRLR